MLQPRSEHDPLLEFSSEPDATPAPPAPLPDDSQPVTPPVVAADPPVTHATADEVALLRVRVGRLEKSLEQMARDLRVARSEVTTLVGTAKDIPPPANSRAAVKFPLRAASAVVGIVLGVALGVWIWTTLGTEPVAPQAAPAAEISDAKPVPPPVEASNHRNTANDAPTNTASNPVSNPVSNAVSNAAVQPAIVQAAAILPVQAAPARSVPARPPVATVPVKERSDRIVTYVGTLSIDADPPGDVFIDRKPAGRTPMRAENLKAGSHLVWIERAGYRRFTRVVEVPADRVSRLVADLEPER